MVPVTTNQIIITFPLLLVYTLLTSINHYEPLFQTTNQLCFLGQFQLMAFIISHILVEGDHLVHIRALQGPVAQIADRKTLQLLWGQPAPRVRWILDMTRLEDPGRSWWSPFKETNTPFDIIQNIIRYSIKLARISYLILSIIYLAEFAWPWTWLKLMASYGDDSPPFQWRKFSQMGWSRLVGGWPNPLKNMSPSVGMIIPNIWENKIHVPNHQPDSWLGVPLLAWLGEDLRFGGCEL